MLPFTAVDPALYTTARVNAARFFPAIGVGVIRPILLLLMPFFTLLLGKRSPFFDRWCRRCAAHFPAVGAAF